MNEYERGHDFQGCEDGDAVSSEGSEPTTSGSQCLTGGDGIDEVDPWRTDSWAGHTGPRCPRGNDVLFVFVMSAWA